MSSHKRIPFSFDAHPVLIPRSTLLEVRWLCHTDKRCYAREYKTANPECAPALLAQAGQIASKGHVGKVPENGHQLKGRYKDLYVLKPGGHRFLGFRFQSTFLLCSGCRKDAKQQDRDYEFALELRTAFLKSASSSEKNK